MKKTICIILISFCFSKGFTQQQQKPIIVSPEATEVNSSKAGAGKNVIFSEDATIYFAS